MFDMITTKVRGVTATRVALLVVALVTALTFAVCSYS